MRKPFHGQSAMTRRGAPSKISEKKWAEIESRASAGESIRALAREFGLSDTAIRKRIGLRVAPIKAVANQLAAAELAMEKLPFSSQVKVRTLADTLKGISHHLGEAAEKSSMTASRLAHIAHVQSALLDETATLDENANAVRSVVVMQEAANKAAYIPLTLLSANKDAIKAIDPSAPEASAARLTEKRDRAIAFLDRQTKAGTK